MVLTALYFYSDPVEEGTFYRNKAYGRYRSYRTNQQNIADKVAYKKFYTKQSEATQTLIAIANVIITLYPIAASVYSKSIYDCKCLSRPRR